MLVTRPVLVCDCVLQLTALGRTSNLLRETVTSAHGHAPTMRRRGDSSVLSLAPYLVGEWSDELRLTSECLCRLRSLLCLQLRTRHFHHVNVPVHVQCAAHGVLPIPGRRGLCAQGRDFKWPPGQLRSCALHKRARQQHRARMTFAASPFLVRALRTLVSPRADAKMRWTLGGPHCEVCRRA